VYKFLKNVELFKDLPDTDLKYLSKNIKQIKLSVGEELFTEGSSGDNAYIIEEGELEILKFSNNRDILLAVRTSGEVIGEIGLLQNVPRMATVRARTNCTLILIDKKTFNGLIHNSPSAARSMFYSVISRWQATEAMLRQSEKMASLGTLSAGVAHELNNPSAAVKRGASQLFVAINQYGWAQREFSKKSFTDEQEKILIELVEQVKNQAKHPVELDSMIRSEREYEIESWLENQGINDAWEFAPTLVDLEFDTAKVANLGKLFSSEQLSFVILWLGRVFTVYTLLTEIGQGAERISFIVDTMNSYSFLDQGPGQNVDVHNGLDNTLHILRSKIKSGISIKREYADDLHKIFGFGAELNQVWTNLLDNALYALNGKGEIVIRTKNSSNDGVLIEIIDNGHGIPENIKDKIFDAFFTTKPPGENTGLGLEISYNIVVNKHRGDIKVISKPGFTSFQVWLPKNFSDTTGVSTPVPGDMSED